MSVDSKLRLHNFTFKAALICGSEMAGGDSDVVYEVSTSSHKAGS